MAGNPESMDRRKSKKLKPSSSSSSSSFDSSLFEKLNESLLMEILARIPCRDAAKFKSVSKRWNSVISSDYFVRFSDHLRHDPSLPPIQTDPDEYRFVFQSHGDHHRLLHLDYSSALGSPSIQCYLGKIVVSYVKDARAQLYRYHLELNPSVRDFGVYQDRLHVTFSAQKVFFRNLKKLENKFVWEDELDATEPGAQLDRSLELVKYDNFVKELILLSLVDLRCYIPSMLDGLKTSQRKILFSAFKKNLIEKEDIYSFSKYIVEKSNYFQNEQKQRCESAIKCMAQNEVGINNINLLQFDKGGEKIGTINDYETILSPVTRFLFREEDDVLLDYFIENGKSIEPTWYIPVIPMVLVNGCEGKGVGWSTYIPKYNPRDIIANLRRLLSGEQMKPMIPWYKGFRGTIEKTETTKAGVTFTCSGTIEEIDETTLGITLPIRRSIECFKKILTSMLVLNEESKDPIVEEFESDDNIFRVKICKGALTKEEDLVKRFKLLTKISTGYMRLFDSRGVIRKYDSPEQILEEFSEVRLDFYHKQKPHCLKNLKREILKLENKVRFVLDVVHGEIHIDDRAREELIQESTESSSFDYLLSMKTLNPEMSIELSDKKVKLEAELECLMNATPESLWLKDLAALEQQLDVCEQEYEA